MEEFRIFKKQLAVELIIRKNNLLYTEKNAKKSWLSVFVFQKTDKLMEDLTELTQK